MDEKIEFFKENGYVVLEGVFERSQAEAWRATYDDLVARRTLPGQEAEKWLIDVVEGEPRLMLSAVANPTLIAFAERVMGPFVQLDSLTFFNFDPVSKEDDTGEATGWHRDRWGGLPAGPQYIRPNACNAITYLQDLTDERGPLRLVPGSHRAAVTISDDRRHEPHPDERLVYPCVGDVVITHCNLLHSGTRNLSEASRHFISIYYNLSWLKHRDNHGGPNVQRILQDARRREDRRTQRLFGVDNQLFWRVNSGHMLPDEEMWNTWIENDRGVLKEELNLEGEPSCLCMGNI
jgi:ectoine hydroxylase-related dioxygenase (phytanoyl-CoA dioxygenase family)